ncbi:MAG: acyltransferase [Clostridiales bacterium]|jgi:serine/alanine racemase|nr:acyltransferase [Clostridiales bacterium]
MKKQYGSFDIAKFVFSFLIIMVHVNFFISKDATFYIGCWLGRFAVPMFFCMAGFFLFNKLQPPNKITGENRAYIKRYLWRILRLFLIWGAIYFPFKIYDWCVNGFRIKYIGSYLKVMILHGMTYSHTWYLGALIYGVICTAFFLHFLSRKKVFAVSVVFYVIGLLISPYYFLIKALVEGTPVVSDLFRLYYWTFGSAQNGVFFAFVFLSLGALLAVSKPVVPKWLCFAGFLIFFAASFFEVTYLRRNESSIFSLQLSLLPLVYFLFEGLRQVELKYRPAYRTLREMSILIYCVHPFFDEIFNGLLKIINPAFYTKPFVAYLMTAAASIVFGYSVLKLENTKKGKFLSYLH